MGLGFFIFGSQRFPIPSPTMLKQPIQLLWHSEAEALAARPWLRPEHIERRGEYYCLSWCGLVEAQKRYDSIVQQSFTLANSDKACFAEFRAKVDTSGYEIDEVYFVFAMWAGRQAMERREELERLQRKTIK